MTRKEGFNLQHVQKTKLQHSKTQSSDEAHFHLDETVNKQNACFRAREHPHNFCDRRRHGRTVTIRVVIFSHQFSSVKL